MQLDIFLFAIWALSERMPLFIVWRAHRMLTPRTRQKNFRNEHACRKANLTRRHQTRLELVVRGGCGRHHYTG